MHDYSKRLESIDPSVEDCFGMISNHATLTAELLSYYLRIWKTPPTPLPSSEEVERLKDQNWRRVNEITKWFYVASMSSFEYSAKKVVEDAQTEAVQKLRQAMRRCKRRRRWVYLSSITHAASEAGLITGEQFKTWQGLVAVRNAVVHNNAIADATVQYTIGGLRVDFHKGQMLKGDLRFFVKLVETLAEQYRCWLEIVLRRAVRDKAAG